MKKAKTTTRSILNEVIDIKNARNNLVVKSNTLIQNTRFNLSVQEQKIILYLISKIEPTDEMFKEYEFDLKHLCDICGIEYNGKNYQNFKNSIKCLADSSFWLIAENGGEVLCRWIEKAYISKNNTSIRIRLDNDLMPYLLTLKSNFTMYELENTLQMQSKYSIRLYELLKSYAYLGKYVVSVEELKKLLNSAKYELYRDFRINVIDKAIKEINEYTDIDITYNPIRTSRTITDIEFIIKKKDMNTVIARGLNRQIETEKRLKLKKELI